METTKRAADLKVGDRVVERCGYLLDVCEVTSADGMVRIKLSSFGPGPNPTAALRRTAMVRVIVATEE